MFRKFYIFFDRFEDKVRGHLSRYPILYGFVGGVGIVLFWRGVWHTADEYAFMTGPVTLVIGSIILLMSGVFVSVFVGNKLILTGLKGEKKWEDQTQEEIISEESKLNKIEKSMHHLEEELNELRKDLK